MADCASFTHKPEAFFEKRYREYTTAKNAKAAKMEEYKRLFISWSLS